jgi:hypothetical protein
MEILEVQETAREQELTGVLLEEGEDRLEKFRNLAPEPKKKMSDAAAAKLRALNEQTKADDLAGEEFAGKLRLIPATLANLRNLIEVHRSARGHLDGSFNYFNFKLTEDELVSRMSHKLLWWCTAGYELGCEIYSVSLINFFSNLTPEETLMSRKQFDSDWDLESAEKRNKSRTKAKEPKELERLCKSGTLCMQFFKKKAAPVKGRGAYCSPACMASDKARAKRGGKI